MTLPLTVWARPITTGQWEPIGVGRGIKPEQEVLTADRWGSLIAKFDLRRDPRASWPDLAAFTPIDVEIGGVRVWAGRLKDTPSRDGADRVMNVQAEGWQAHLDDHPVERFYTHSRLADWKDTRSMPTADLARFRSGYQVRSENGQIVLAYPNGAAFAAGEHWVGVTLDLGPDQIANALSIDWDSSNSGSGVTIYGRSGSSPWPTGGTDAFSFAHNSGASGTTTNSFSAGGRYVHLFMYFAPGSPGTFSADHWFRIKEARVFAAADYRSGAASVLKSSHIVADVAQFAEKLSPDLSGIEMSTFSIPDYAPGVGRTAREHITAANAYEDWQASVDVDMRLRYRPLPDEATLQAGSAEGFTFDDASANSGEDIYNAARIEAEQPDGTPLRFLRLGGGSTIVDRWEFTKAKTLPVRSTLTQAAGERIADKWLTYRDAAPLKGKAQVTGDRAVRGPAGQPLPPYLLLLRAGELLAMDHLVNPVTGGLGRDGRVVQVTYSHAEGRAELDIDNSRATFDALLAQFDAIVGR